MIAAILGTFLSWTLVSTQAGVPYLRDDEPALIDADVLPKELVGVEVKEKLEVKVPTDLPFIDEAGRAVTLKEVMGDGLPTILTFNYANCPMLCSVQLGGLVEVLRAMEWHAGKQFHVVTIGLDPKQTPERTAELKKHYLERYGVDTAARGWRFVRGSEQNIRALADSVGYGYRYLAERNDYAHPAAFVVLSPSGVVTSYQYGVQFEPEKISAALASAVLGRPQESVQKFLLACFHYAPKPGNSQKARQIMRVSGLVFVLGLGGFFFWNFQRRHRRDHAC